MVNNPRRTLWIPPPLPLSEDELGRRLPGPIYELGVVQSLVCAAQIHVATDRCEQSLEDLEWDLDDVAGIMLVLQPQDYHTSEWCTGRSRIVLDADAYQVRYDDLERCRGDWRHPEYYIKFAFRNNDPRLIVWLFSCHLST